MEHLIDGVRDAVDNESWYAALALALALPDACAAIEQPGRGRSGQRYTRWADDHFTPYTRDPTGRPFLTGRELYLLRCAFLHAGELEVDDGVPRDPDDARAMFEVLNEVMLYVSELDVVPARGMATIQASPLIRGTSYSVAVKDLCEWICRAAESWLQYARNDSRMAAAIASSCRIRRINPEGTITEL